MQRLTRDEFLAAVLDMDRRGLTVPEQARALGLREDTYRRRMSRWGYQRQTPRTYWVPVTREEAEA